MQEIYWNLTRLYQLYKTVGSPIKHGGQLKSWKSIFFLIQSNKYCCATHQVVKGWSGYLLHLSIIETNLRARPSCFQASKHEVIFYHTIFFTVCKQNGNNDWVFIVAIIWLMEMKHTSPDSYTHLFTAFSKLRIWYNFVERLLATLKKLFSDSSLISYK